MIELQLYHELDDLSRLVVSKDVTVAQKRKALSNVESLQQKPGRTLPQQQSV